MLVKIKATLDKISYIFAGNYTVLLKISEKLAI